MRKPLIRRKPMTRRYPRWWHDLTHGQLSEHVRQWMRRIRFTPTPEAPRG